MEILKETEPTETICILVNSEGESVPKIFQESLAKKWNLNIVFTGTYGECNKNWSKYKSKD